MESYHPGTCPTKGRGRHSWTCFRRGRSSDGCTLLKPRHPLYLFGNWGCHTSAHDSQIMPGFSPTPPGRELCGAYKIIFVGALHYKKGQQQSKVLLGRQPKTGSLIIEESTQAFTVGVNGRRITDQVLFDGEVSLPNGSRGVDCGACGSIY